ncbi:DUF1697 domain-containing protein [Leifsonia aquatica]|uniref:DUF1697 domain-containing protein n=1 Tax=Leifsonia aquatica TaxID=144185 RepID=UPI00384D163F
MTAYVALLRGINVGGRNAVDMTELAALVEELGNTDVSTHSASGNVLFTAPSTTSERLEEALETGLADRFGFAIPTLVRSHDELAATVAAAPRDHGSAELRSEVFFLKRPLTAEEVLAQLPELGEGVDAVAPGPGALYFSRVAALATKTRITRLMAMPVFRSMTVRSWTTTTRLLQKLDGLEEPGADGRLS